MKRCEEIQYFYHTLSHELKTPLTSAREFVSIVIDGLAGELNPTQLDYLRMAKDSCTDLAVYINDLLDATRLETGKLHVELKAASLAAIIQRAMAIVEPVASAKNIRLREDLDTRLKDVMVDESRIMQVVTNLLNNAIKFTFEGGEVIVKLARIRRIPKTFEFPSGITVAAFQKTKSTISSIVSTRSKMAAPLRRKASAWDCIFVAKWCCCMGEAFGWKAPSGVAALFHSRSPSRRT